MAGTNPPVRIKLAWQQYSVGEVIHPNGLLRDWLISNGYAEPLLPGKAPGVRNKAKVATQAVGALFTR